MLASKHTPGALVGIGMPLSSSAAVRRHDPGRGFRWAWVVASPVDAGPRARLPVKHGTPGVELTLVSHTLVHAWHRHASGAYADLCRLAAVALLDRMDRSISCNT
jgi:hypothetical protein